MKKVLVLILAFLFTFALVACGGNAANNSGNDDSQNTTVEANTGNDNTVQENPWGEYPVASKWGSLDASEITIGAIMNQEDQHQSTVIKGIQAACNDYGVKLVYSFMNDDVAKQMELMDTWAGQGVQGMLPCIQDESIWSYVVDYADSGLPVCLPAAGTSEDYIDHTFGCYGNSNYTMSQTCAELSAPIISDLYGDETVNIALLTYETQNAENSKVRSESFLGELDKAGINYEVVASQSSWLAEDATQVVGDILVAHPEVDVIYSCSEGGLIGAINAIQAAERDGEIFVFGIDVSAQILKLMEESESLMVAVGNDSYTSGYMNAECLINVLMGNTGEYEDHFGKFDAIPDCVLNKKDPATLDTYRDLLKGLDIL